MRRSCSETVIGLINRAKTVREMRSIDAFVNQTTIEGNFENISRAWREKMKEFPGEESLTNGVPGCLENQNRETEEEKRQRLADEMANIAADARLDIS